jgi:RNA ligase (TIGR02306 family)
MPQFTVPVVRVEKIEKHPNADSLSITEIEGNPVVFRTQDFKEGDSAVYLPIESLVPEHKEWVKKFCSHLKFKHSVHRVKAIRLRGIFSMGVLLPIAALDFEGIPSAPTVGEDVSETLGIKKYEEPDDQNFEQKSTPRKPVTFWDHVKYAFYKLFRISNKKRKITRPMPVYDADHYRKFHDVFVEGEEVVASCKIHGTNFAAGYHKKRFWVSSHRVLRPSPDNSFYWRAVRKYDLEQKLKAYPDLIFFGEVYGPEVQDMGYGLQHGHVGLVLFDIYDVKNSKYLDYDDFKYITYEAGLPTVPELYRGPYNHETIAALKDGPSILANGAHPREGIVIRPIKERLDRRCGRVSLKLISEWYLLRKDGKEGH